MVEMPKKFSTVPIFPWIQNYFGGKKWGTYSNLFKSEKDPTKPSVFGFDSV
jgi:hypothetical protein